MADKKVEMAELDTLLESFQKFCDDGEGDDFLTTHADKIIHQLNKVTSLVGGNHAETQLIQRQRQGFEQLVVKIVAKRHAPLLAARYMRYYKTHH